MGKEYKIKATKKLLRQLRPFWQEVRKTRDRYDLKLRKLEEEMAKKTGIKNIEFFFCDNEIAGIGNVERTMPLIQDQDREISPAKVTRHKKHK